MAQTITEFELLKLILKSFDINSEQYINKTLQLTYVNLSTNVKSIDRVDNIASIIYGFSEDEFINIQRFFGLLEDDKEDYFSGFIEEIKNKEIVTPQGEKLNEAFSKKFSEHIRLCCFQRNFMMAVSKNAEEIAMSTLELADTAKDAYDTVGQAVKKAERSANSAKNISTEAKKIAVEAEKVKGKIYSEFIAILGIFTAISFMSMGSLQVLGDLFKDVKNPTSSSLGYAMIIGGIYISIMYVFIIIMFVGMKKVIGNGDKYNFSTGVCALVLITVCTLIGIGLFMVNCLIPGLMFITVCIVGLIVAFLATQSITTETE
ncbi:hypothetical protein JW886_07455 [Lactococcus taiwanensis]|uniref:Uncharacterized protein n=1 Tax=Lactococcus taiwanensis TaxID=1151742 RepID=A0AA45KFB6_9LACT|nr:hypothetical protein [Lactococcus taiwanensis]QSE76298.1 hypothetical protein JW886_07455 [Lactococcus taiwanensis]